MKSLRSTETLILASVRTDRAHGCHQGSYRAVEPTSSTPGDSANLDRDGDGIACDKVG